MILLKILFKSPETKYFYFKKVTNFYYGLCGCKEEHVKIKQCSGSFGSMYDALEKAKLNRKGFNQCSKEEYDKRNKQ